MPPLPRWWGVVLVFLGHKVLIFFEMGNYPDLRIEDIYMALIYVIYSIKTGKSLTTIIQARSAK
jgi:hypothetical protein